MSRFSSSVSMALPRPRPRQSFARASRTTHARSPPSRAAPPPRAHRTPDPPPPPAPAAPPPPPPDAPPPHSRHNRGAFVTERPQHLGEAVDGAPLQTPRLFPYADDLVEVVLMEIANPWGRHARESCRRQSGAADPAKGRRAGSQTRPVAIVSSAPGCRFARIAGVRDLAGGVLLID